MHVRKSSAIGGTWRQAESQSTRQEHKVDGMKDNMAREVLKGESRDGSGGGRGLNWHRVCRRRVSGHTGVISIGFSTDLMEFFPLVLYFKGSVPGKVSNEGDWERLNKLYETLFDLNVSKIHGYVSIRLRKCLYDTLTLCHSRRSRC